MSAVAAEQEQNYLQGDRGQKLLDLLDYHLAANNFLLLQIVKATQLDELQRSPLVIAKFNFSFCTI